MRVAHGGAAMLFNMTAPPGQSLKMEIQYMMNSDRPESGPSVRLLRWTQSVVASFRQVLARSAAPMQPRILVVVEGPNDIEFLRRISAILHRNDPRLPDLADREGRLDLVFVPSGGGDLSSAFRFAGLNLPEFHLLDRDVPPATQSRQRVAAMVNSRPGCRAVITSKRSLENFLHRDAVFEASGIPVVFSDDENVPELVARRMYECHEQGDPWDQLPDRARKRLRNKAKKWLNARAVQYMTPARLAERDPSGEIRSWLATIASLSGR
jgi:hypothetical protein